MSLVNFYQDEITREEVKNFLFQECDRYALEKVYNKEDTKGVAETKEVIERAFSELESLFKRKKEKEITNPAR